MIWTIILASLFALYLRVAVSFGQFLADEARTAGEPLNWLAVIAGAALWPLLELWCLIEAGRDG